MNVYKPESITAAKLIASTLFETAPAVYAAGTTYALGAYAAVAGALGRIDIYVSLQAGNIGNTPVSSPTFWAYSSYTYEIYDANKVYPNLYRVINPTTHRVFESLSNLNTNNLTIGAARWVFRGIAVNNGVSEFNANIESHNGSGGYTVIGENYLTNAVVGVGNQTQFRADLYKATIDYAGACPGADWTYQSSVTGTYGLWNPKRRYGIGYLVVDYSKNIWQSAIANNLNYDPTSASKWQDVGPSNYWAAFDTESFSQSTGSGLMTFTIAPGVVDTVALINAEADLVEITVREGLGGAIIHEASSGVLGNLITDWWEYFQSDLFIDRRQIMFKGLPLSANAHITVTLTGATLALGDLIFSRGRNLGLTGFGLQVGIKDFSVIKENEDFGTTTFVKRRNRKRMDCREWIPKDQFNRTFTVLSDLPATPCVWEAGDVNELNEALMLKAWYKDFTTEINGPYELFCNLKLEGMT